jgi:hypothetical protein
MPTVNIVSAVNIDLESLLDGVAQLDLAELERFALEVNHLVAQRKAPSLPKRESELLQQINQGLPDARRKRYEELNEKLLGETLEPAEHEELGGLIDEIEWFDVERLRNLIELAHLRGVPLDQLMAQLGIQRSLYAQSNSST